MKCVEKFSIHRIIIAAIFLCSLAVPAHSTPGGPEEAETCTSLTLTKKEQPETLSELSLQASDEAGTFTPTVSQTVAAPCSCQIRVYNGEFHMRDGRTLITDRTNIHTSTILKPGEDGSIFDSKYDSKFYADGLSTEGNPLAEADGFIGSYKAFPLARDGVRIVTAVLGIWQVDDKYEVRIFHVRDGEVVGEVKPVLSSDRPIRSIAFHLGPDAGFGLLSLLLENPDHSVDAVTISWQRPWWIFPNAA